MFRCSLLALFCFPFLLITHSIIFWNPHQQVRINELLGIESNPYGAGYHVNQSKIAIGSGGMWGKGYLNGTQTKYNFVPEQDTDFIFCTVGEEWGFAGTFIVIALFLTLFIRLIWLAERQRSVSLAYLRIFGSCYFVFPLCGKHRNDNRYNAGNRNSSANFLVTVVRRYGRLPYYCSFLFAWTQAASKTSETAGMPESWHMLCLFSLFLLYSLGF